MQGRDGLSQPVELLVVLLELLFIGSYGTFCGFDGRPRLLQGVVLGQLLFQENGLGLEGFGAGEHGLYRFQRRLLGCLGVGLMGDLGLQGL